MALLRSVLQVRTVPERLMEWALVFVPPPVFEAILLQFGFVAKRYALFVAIAATLLFLTTIGGAALWQRWSIQRMLGLGIGLWLLTMMVIMPITAPDSSGSRYPVGRRRLWRGTSLSR